MGEVIDLTNPPIFKSNQWIGQGQCYDTKTLPTEVIEVHSIALSIPSAY